jgi:mRNA interferase RelE/StbE
VRGWQVDIPPHVAEIVRRLPPEVKRAVREALRGLAEDPRLGEALQGELVGLSKYRVRRYRIVYAVDGRRRRIQVHAIGHRRTVYDEVVDARR